jgi:hypothetical protein
VVVDRCSSGSVGTMTSSGSCGGSSGSGSALASARQTGHETAVAASGGVSCGRHVDFDLLFVT